jgi:hypothetical protein
MDPVVPSAPPEPVDLITEILDRIKVYEKIIEKILKSATLSPKQEKDLEDAYNILETCDIELEALGYFDGMA